MYRVKNKVFNCYNDAYLYHLSQCERLFKEIIVLVNDLYPEIKKSSLNECISDYELQKQTLINRLYFLAIKEYDIIYLILQYTVVNNS